MPNKSYILNKIYCTNNFVTLDFVCLPKREKNTIQPNIYTMSHIG